MSKRPILKAELRKLTGRKIKSLRRQGIMPGSVYGKKASAQNLQLPVLDFLKVYKSVGETTLLDLTITGEKSARPVLIKAVQYHPVTNLPLHADFHQVSLTEKVTANIPLEIVGVSPAVSDSGAVLVHALQELEVEALPTDLPDKIEVPIAKLLAFGDSILVKDLTVDLSKVTVLSGADETVATVQEPKKEEVVVEPTPEASAEAGEAAPFEAETTVQGKPEIPTSEPPPKT